MNFTFIQESTLIKLKNSVMSHKYVKKFQEKKCPNLKKKSLPSKKIVKSYHEYEIKFFPYPNTYLITNLNFKNIVMSHKKKSKNNCRIKTISIFFPIPKKKTSNHIKDKKHTISIYSELKPKFKSIHVLVT